MGSGGVVEVVVVEAAMLFEHRGDAIDDLVEQRGDVFVDRRWQFDESRAGIGVVGLRDEDTVGDQDMEVKRQFQSTVE